MRYENNLKFILSCKTGLFSAVFKHLLCRQQGGGTTVLASVQGFRSTFFFFLISGEIPLLKQFCEENLARLVFSSYSCSAKMRYYLIWEFPSFNDSFFLLLIWEIAVVKTHRISRHWVIQQLHNFNQNADFYAVSINSYTSENTVLEMCMYVRLSADAFISVVLFFQVLIDQEKERRGGTWMSCLYTYISCL